MIGQQRPHAVATSAIADIFNQTNGFWAPRDAQVLPEMKNMEESDDSLKLNAIARPQTGELVELHIYVVPTDNWIEKRKLAKRDIVDYAISSGFVRVLPSASLKQLRSDITDQLGNDYVPDTFVFLRGVGRNFTQVKPRQEQELRVKSFVPPYAEEPEIYLKVGDYVTYRSSSLESHVPIAEELTLAYPVGLMSEPSEALEPNAENPGPDILIIKIPEESRSQSLDRIEPRIVHTTQRKKGRLQGPNSRFPFKQPPHKLQRSFAGHKRNNRPPTPRVEERSIGSLSSERLTVQLKKEQSSLSEAQKENNQDVELRSVLDHKQDSEPSNSIATQEHPVQPEPSIYPTETLELSETTINSIADKQQAAEEDFEEVPEIIYPTADIKISNRTEYNEKKEQPTEPIPPSKEVLDRVTDQSSDEMHTEESVQDKLTTGERNDEAESSNSKEVSTGGQDEVGLDIERKKNVDDGLITDPLKLANGEESVFDNLKDGRDHFDEGFHSGELVVSEDEGNFDSKLKRSKYPQPVRAGTPMPRGSSYYRPINMDPEIEKIRMMYDDVRSQKRLRELKRDALMAKTKELQNRKSSTRDRVREEWRRRYLEVKKLSPRLEDHCTKLRQELEKLVKEMLVKVKDTESEEKPNEPSKKTSFKIMIMRLLQEIEDLRRRLQSVSVRLNAENKLREQAEYEVKKLRQDLLRKKTQVTLTRKQATFPRLSQQFFISAV